MSNHQLDLTPDELIALEERAKPPQPRKVAHINHKTDVIYFFPNDSPPAPSVPTSKSAIIMDHAKDTIHVALDNPNHIAPDSSPK